MWQKDRSKAGKSSQGSNCFSLILFLKDKLFGPKTQRHSGKITSEQCGRWISKGLDSEESGGGRNREGEKERAQTHGIPEGTGS